MTHAAHGTLFSALSDTARRLARETAATFLRSGREPKAYTFGELFESAGALSKKVAALSLDRRAPVGILVESQECQVLHYLALLGAGHVPAILTPPSRKFDRTYYAETMSSVMARCGFAAVVSDFPEVTPGVRTLRPFTFDASGPEAPPPVDDCSGAAFLQFSSGTTGMKRGVVIEQRAALAQLNSYGAALGLRPGDRIVSWLPLYHDFGFIAAVNLPLLTGTPVVMLQPLDWVADPVSYLHAVTRYRGTVGFHPNFAFAFMAHRVAERDTHDLDLSSLRALVNASETVTYSSQSCFLSRFAPHGLRPDVFCGLYGMAEMTLALVTASSGDHLYLDHVGPIGSSAGSMQRPVVSVGKPLPGVEIRIVGDDGRVLGDREIGEVHARGPCAFSRYYNNPDATAHAFRDGWYLTGDLGYRVGDMLFICGRRGEVLVINGVNVYPQDLEEMVSSVPGIKGGRTVVFSVADPSAGSDRIVVLAESEPGADQETCVIEARRRVCSVLQLSGIEVEIVPPRWLLKSSAGKLARDLNRQKWLDAAVHTASPT